ncbi:MAG: hypothetical protein BJ554DRAFT_6651, partial [Olpidium bornovanus]
GAEPFVGRLVPSEALRGLPRVPGAPFSRLFSQVALLSERDTWSSSEQTLTLATSCCSPLLVGMVGKRAIIGSHANSKVPTEPDCSELPELVKAVTQEFGVRCFFKTTMTLEFVRQRRQTDGWCDRHRICRSQFDVSRRKTHSRILVRRNVLNFSRKSRVARITI